MNPRKSRRGDPFAGKARDYDRWYHTSAGAFIDRVETDLAFALCPPVAGERVLDVGTGTGNFAAKLYHHGCRVTGIDISPDMLARARQKAVDEGFEARWILADVTSIPLPDATYDAVYSMTAVEFVPDLAAAHREMMRVLKPGGRLLVGTIAGDGPWGLAYAQRAREKPDSIFAHARFPTLEEVLALDPDDVEASGECLYVPPDADEDDFNSGMESAMREAGRPAGFLCVLWRKPPGDGAP